jgi:hypothetical protein
MAGLNFEKFEKALEEAARRVDDNVSLLAASRSDLARIARAAHVAGMTERGIARITKRSGPAVHAWLHAKDKNGG